MRSRFFARKKHCNAKMPIFQNFEKFTCAKIRTFFSNEIAPKALQICPSNLLKLGWHGTSLTPGRSKIAFRGT